MIKDAHQWCEENLPTLWATEKQLIGTGLEEHMVISFPQSKSASRGIPICRSHEIDAGSSIFKQAMAGGTCYLIKVRE